MDEIDFKIVPTNNEDKIVKLKKAFKYLNRLREPSKIVSDLKAFEAIYYIKYLFNDDESFVEQNSNWQYFLKTKFDQLLVNLIYYLADSCDTFEINNKLKIYRNEINANADLNERKITILDHLVVIINRLVDLQFKNASIFDFTKRLFENKIIHALMEFFKHKKFHLMHSDDYDPGDQILSIVATIRNFSENPNYEKSIWKSLNMEKALNDFAVECNHHEIYMELMNEILTNLNQKTLDECLVFLSTQKDPTKLIDNQEAYFYLFQVKSLVKLPTFKQYDLFSKYDCLNLFQKILNSFYEKKSKLNWSKSSIHIRGTVPNADLNDRRVSIFYYLLMIINDLVFRSIEMNVYFGTISLVKTLVEFLSEDFYTKITENKKIVLILLIKNLSILSRWTDEVKGDWNKLKLVDKLLKFINLFKKNEQEYKELIVSSYYCIGNISEDEQIETLPEVAFVINQLLEELVALADHYQNGKFLKKVETQLINDDNRIETFQVSYLNRTLTGTLYGLTRFSVNEKSKAIIFQKFDSIKIIINKGVLIEKVWALKLLAQLCFSDEIAQKVITDSELCRQIQDLNASALNKDLKKVTQTILWFLSNKLVELNKNKDYVVISYHPSTKYLCQKIKTELEKRGIDVWLDLDKLNGQSIDTAAIAIERSRCVLIGVCEKYRLSEQNQAQAQYAAKLDKQIIALIMQDGYENIHGWLGNLIKDKVKVNFKNSNFNQSIDTLVENINGHINIEPIMESTMIDFELDPEKWTQEEVRKWFSDNKIHESIAKLYDKIDGFTLKQIHSMKNLTPEFFFQTFNLELKQSAKTMDIAYFIGKLDKLFSAPKNI